MEYDDNRDTSGYTKPLSTTLSDTFSQYSELPSHGYCRLLKAQRHGRWYILKGLQPQHQADPAYLAMLEKEFLIAIQMSHPNIVNTIQIANNTEVGPCIVMEYVEGRTLNQYLAEHPGKGARRRIVGQLVEAMIYYHSHQVTHRDLKPSNILITNNGDNLKVIDFGLADTDDYSALKEPGYSRGYAAPEQTQ